jgi:AcrR family transcriptional regulator
MSAAIDPLSLTSMPSHSRFRAPDSSEEGVDALPPEIVDGRRKRGEDNRNRISQAFLSLVVEGVVTPTAEDVAHRAGVGLRSVFRHFSDMEMLYREMIAHAQRLTRELTEPPRQDQHWQSVLDEMIEGRATVYEQIMPFQIAAQVHQHESAFLRAYQEHFADLQRTALLNALPKELLRDKSTLEAVNLALSFETWMRLRREQRLNRAAAKRVVALTCSALLKGQDRAAD